MGPLIEARQLAAGYGRQPVVHELDLTVRPGEIVALLGPNGAGKTTALLTLAGALPAIDGEVWFAGASRTDRLHRRARRGLSLVTEERSVIKSLSTKDNLRLGCSVDAALELFPELEPLLARPAGLLSGGEQQMLSLARAIARKPDVLLADELSLGLAPLVIDRLLTALRTAADDGVGILVVEQHARKVLRVADTVHVMRRGRVELSGTAEEMRGRLADIERSYLASAVAP